MSSPKPLRILEAITARLAVISQAAGYYSDIGCRVRADRRDPLEAELPCCSVILGERLAGDTHPKRARVEMPISVVAFAALEGRDSEVAGSELLADLCRAVELEDSTLGGLLQESQYGLTFVSEEIFQPEAGTNVVGARITYACPHIRRSGDPEIL